MRVWAAETYLMSSAGPSSQPIIDGQLDEQGANRRS